MLGKEPTVILGAISEVIRQIVPTLIIFGIINWNAEQVAQFGLLIGVIIGSLTVVLTRSQVVATKIANSQIETAVNQPAGTSVERVIEIDKENRNDE